MGNGKGFNIEGARVGILGGSGGVGSFAIQMAKALGAAFVITTSSNVEMVTNLGADEVINYREKDVVESMTGKDLDLVFDCVGGVESWNAAQQGLKKGGHFATIVGDSPVVSIGLLPGIINRKFWSNFCDKHQYRLFLTNSESPSDLNAIKKMIEEKKVKVLVDERKFLLTTESVHEFFTAIMSHRTKGKLVLDITAAMD
jgi:NADPH:quinone reductase-like Zn-dependent oxidoreductase